MRSSTLWCRWSIHAIVRSKAELTMCQPKTNRSLRNRPNCDPISHQHSTRHRLKAAIRYLLTGVMLMASASTVAAVSCGVNCNAKCEQRTALCISTPASICLDAGAYPCTLATGCTCGTVTDPKVGCNINGCVGAEDPDKCARTPGCVWGDVCRDLIDCHSLESESACRANAKQCYWSRDCG